MGESTNIDEDCLRRGKGGKGGNEDEDDEEDDDEDEEEEEEKPNCKEEVKEICSECFVDGKRRPDKECVKNCISNSTDFSDACQQQFEEVAECKAEVKETCSDCFVDGERPNRRCIKTCMKESVSEEC